MKQQTYLSNNPYAELSSQDGQSKIIICTYGYAYPEITEGLNADWHKNYLYLSVPGFRAEVDEIILNGDILNCYFDQLQGFSKFLKSEVYFRPIKPYFGLRFKFDTQKNVNVDCYVDYPLEFGARLEFTIVTDLTYVDKFIEGLKDILTTYPPR